MACRKALPKKSRIDEVITNWVKKLKIWIILKYTVFPVLSKMKEKLNKAKITDLEFLFTY